MPVQREHYPEENAPFIRLLPGGAGQKPVVLRTKLHIPRPRENLVPRPRLLARLQAAMKRPLTLVSAPAGYGKTTVLAAWAAGCACPVAWLSLDESDNDPMHFWTYIIAALQTLQEDIGVQALAVLQTMGAGQPEAFLNTLLNELAGTAGEWTLVLDDYHLIKSPELHRTLAYFVDHLSEHVHLVIASRTRPPLPLARLAVRDQLVEVDKQALSFSCEEAVTFFARAQVPHLSEHDICLLQTKTEGWAAALQLAALSLRGQTDAARFAAGLSGSQRRIAEFLMAEVYQQQPAETQDFLLKTSILDRLSAPLCAAVLGDAIQGAQAMLERLEGSNLLLVALDDDRRWYRCHHLFAEFLRDRLRQTYPNLVPELYRRASVGYEEQGETALAIQAAIAGEDYERAAHSIESGYEEMVKRSEMATLLGWIEALPAEFVRVRPRLCLARAWALQTVQGHLDDMEACLEDAENAVRREEIYSQDAVERASILGEIAHLRSNIAILRNEPERAIALSHEALKLLPSERLFLHRASSMHLGYAYTAVGQTQAARRHLTEVLRSEEATANVHVGLWVRNNLAGLEALEGNLRAAAETYRAALKVATLPDGTYLPVAMASHIGLARLFYEWNDLASALGHLRLGIELGRRWWVPRRMIHASITLARVRQAQGDAEGALAAVQQAEDLLQHEYLVSLLEHVAAAQLRSWLQAGHLQRAGSMIGALQRTLHIDRDISPMQQDEVLVVGRWLVAEGDFQAASRWLAPLVGAAERGGLRRRLIEGMVLQALAYWGAGNRRQARFVLARALELAEPEGYVRVFVDEGAPMRALLEEAAAHGVAPAYTNRLLAAMGPALRHAARGAPALAEPLSERELQVLRLLAAGLSPQEVAQKLVIGLATVRSHEKNIYAKLQVHNRLHAVKRAHELDLL